MKWISHRRHLRYMTSRPQVVAREVLNVRQNGPSLPVSDHHEEFTTGDTEFSTRFALRHACVCTSVNVSSIRLTGDLSRRGSCVTSQGLNILFLFTIIFSLQKKVIFSTGG